MAEQTPQPPALQSYPGMPPYWPGYMQPPPHQHPAPPPATSNAAKIKIASVKMAWSPNGQADLKYVHRTSIREITEDGKIMTVSEMSRKVLEMTPHWLIQVAKYIEKVREDDKGAVLISYGSGYATLVLLNGAELPKEMNKIDRVGIDVVIAKTNLENPSRFEEYGVVNPSDSIWEHYMVGVDEYEQGAAIYLMPSQKNITALGAWEEGSDDKKIFRLEMHEDNPDPRTDRCHDLEKFLQTGVKPPKKSKTSRKKATTAKPAAPIAESKDDKAEAPTAAAAKKTKEKKTASNETPATEQNAKTAKKSTSKDVPAKETSEKATTKKAPSKEKEEAASVSKKKVSKEKEAAASDPKKKVSKEPAANKKAPPKETPESSSDAEEDEALASPATTASEDVSPAPERDFVFNPKEVRVLVKAYENKLTSRDLSADVTRINKKDIKEAKRIMREVEEGLRKEKEMESEEEQGDEGEEDDDGSSNEESTQGEKSNRHKEATSHSEKRKSSDAQEEDADTSKPQKKKTAKKSRVEHVEAASPLKKTSKSKDSSKTPGKPNRGPGRPPGSTNKKNEKHSDKRPDKKEAESSKPSEEKKTEKKKRKKKTSEDPGTPKSKKKRDSHHTPESKKSKTQVYEESEGSESGMEI